MKIREDKEWNEKSEKKALSICVSEGWIFFDDAHYVSLYNLSFKAKLETGAKLV